MIHSRQPEGAKPAHSFVARHHVHQRVLERVAHV